ncbi:MAG: polysialyltransferase family glycosyltransferase [Verrucomicrobiota bacterium JB022]|nr:polysialyltransferase family glycosyltransferase [Verrucomicrobiota bacterium JB022]
MAQHKLKILWITGTWHLILARAVLAQQGQTVTPEEWVVAVSGGRSSPEFRQRLAELCRLGFPGVEVIDVPYTAAWDHELLQFFLALMRRRGASGYSDFWTCFPTEPPVRCVNLISPGCRCWGIEDGLVTYAPTFSTLPRTAGRSRVGQLAAITGPALTHSALTPLFGVNQKLYRKVLRRLQFKNSLPLTRYYGLLNDLLPDFARGHPQELIRPEILQAEVEAFRQLIGYQPPEFDQPTLLFLGDNLHAIMGDQAAAVEDLTIQWLRHVIDLGYQVYWKPHPRAAASLTEKLISRFDDQELRRAPDLDMAPAEVAFAVPSLAGVISMLSSACFYFPRYFDIPSYRFPFPWEAIDLPLELKEVLALSEAEVMPIDRLPPATLVPQSTET